MMRMSRGDAARVAAVFLVVLGAAPPVWAGAWTLPKNRWYVEYFYRYFQSKHTFDRDGKRVRRPKAGFFSDIRNELKLEYGLTDWWNVLASVPYLSSHFRDDGVDLLRTGVQDVSLRTKFRFLHHPILVAEQPLVGSAQFSVKIPTYDANENPLGDGQVDVESRLQLSQAWAFSPYEVDVSRRAPKRADVAPRAFPSRPADPVSREAAIRDAVILAELIQGGTRLYEEGDYAEAAKWFQAALESDPSHYEALRTVLNHAARAVAEASLDGPPRAILVSEDTFEPIFDDQPEQTGYEAFGGGEDESEGVETRYARVAFVNLEGAYTVRNADPPNEFPLFAEVGFTPFKRLMVVGSVDSIVSARSTEHEESFAKWGVRGILNVWGDGFASVFRTGGPTVNIEVGYNDIFDGRNTADAFEVFAKLGIFF